MPTSEKNFATIDAYIATFSAPVQLILEKIRSIIKQVAPHARETISYQIAAFTLDDRYLVYLAAWKNHISLYPIPVGNSAFQKEIAPYLHGKGTVRFSFDQAIPYDLIKKIVQYLLDGHQ